MPLETVPAVVVALALLHKLLPKRQMGEPNLLSKILAGIGYATAVAITVIVSGGIALPAWIVPALAGAGAVAGHMAQSPIHNIHDAAVTAKAAGEAAKIASDAAGKKI